MMACQYCPHHQRALLSAGWDFRAHRLVPAHWHPLSLGSLALAMAVANVWACAAHVVLMEMECDICAQEAAP